MSTLYVAFVLFIGIYAEFDPETHKNWKLLPHDICGKSSFSDKKFSHRIIGGKVAPLNGFPWLARIGFSYALGTRFPCAGVLINSDTVLSAAHCFVGMKSMKLGPIRLGEYNTATNPDCEVGICAEPVLDVTPLKVLVPKNYTYSLLKNDIAIVKLKKNVSFSESIWPICIGNKEFFSRDFNWRISEVAGWGYNDAELKKHSKLLEVVRLPILPYEVCAELYQAKKNISAANMCAGMFGLDACNGDSGGPLMIVDNVADELRYYLLGIVSFGPAECGNPNYPGIYTNLTTFLSWFFDNLDGAGHNATELYKNIENSLNKFEKFF